MVIIFGVELQHIEKISQYRQGNLKLSRIFFTITIFHGSIKASGKSSKFVA